jgi:glycerate-2-kinase
MLHKGHDGLMQVVALVGGERGVKGTGEGRGGRNGRACTTRLFTSSHQHDTVVSSPKPCRF